MPPRRAASGGHRGRPRRNPGPLVGGRDPQYDEPELVSDGEDFEEHEGAQQVPPVGWQDPPAGWQAPSMATAGVVPAVDPSVLLQQMVALQAPTL